jgi:sugar phosphate isomerase/epimerase
MKLAYQVAMPEVAASYMLTAYKGELSEGFRLLKENGYDGAELMICETGKAAMDTLKRLCAEFHMEISALVTGELYAHEGLSLSNHDPAVRAKCIDRFHDFINIAAEFGAQVNIGRSRGLYEPGVPHEQTYAWAIESLRTVAEYAEQKKVTLILEPVNFLQCDFILSTRDGRDIVDRIGSPYFKIMLDVFHMNIQDKDMRAEIRTSKGYFTYVHLCDNNRLYPGNCGFDFAAIIAALKETEYDGYVAVEILQQPDMPTAIRESARHLLPLLK